MKRVYVWDLPTRIFHWSMVVLVGLAYIVSSGRPYGATFLIHVASGYAVALLVLFRLAWGIVGGEHARFAAFLADWNGIKAHARALLRLSPQRTTGHNAIGGWAIVLILVTLALIIVTGLLSQGKTGGAGPLSWVLPTALVGTVGEIHQFLGNLILYLAGFHVLGVIAESLLLRENLTRAMIDGHKHDERPEARDARRGPAWLAVSLALLLAVLGGYMASMTRVPTRPGTPAIEKSEK